MIEIISIALPVCIKAVPAKTLSCKFDFSFPELIIAKTIQFEDGQMDALKDRSSSSFLEEKLKSRSSSSTLDGRNKNENTEFKTTQSTLISKGSTAGMTNTMASKQSSKDNDGWSIWSR